MTPGAPPQKKILISRPLLKMSDKLSYGIDDIWNNTPLKKRKVGRLNMYQVLC
jgi:hypothetical protein